MKYLSVCSGIEAATVAWHPLGWTPAAFSEIEPFPSAVLAERWAGVPNLGDMTQFASWPLYAINLLVGGTPCQSFSIAGLRKGLDDPRGNLMLTFGAIAARYRPEWLLWENVPGVLSSNGGRDFASFLGLLTGQLIEVPAGGWQNSGIVSGIGDAYGLAYRVLDAQYAGVPQRRRRVFVVGHLGDWRRAAAVLFERHSLQGHSAPSRETGKGTSRGFEVVPSGGSFTDLAPTLDARCKDGPIRNQLGMGVAHSGAQWPAEVAPTLNAHFGDKQGLEDQHVNGGCGLFVSNALRGEGFDASEDGTGRGTPLVPVAFAENSRAELRLCGGDGRVSSQLTTGGGKPGQGQPCVAFAHQGGGIQTTLGYEPDSRTTPTIPKSQTLAVHTQTAVRRLTPKECERLQGFPDDYTAITYRGKPAADGPRYKALGNSMAVPCMRWIGQRIQSAADIG